MAITFDPNDGPPLVKNGAATSTNGKHDAPPSHQATRGEFWRPAAPRKLRSGQLNVAEAWTYFWRKRKQPRPLSQLCRSTTTPLAWALAAGQLPPSSQTLLDLLDRIAPKGKTETSGRSETDDAAEAGLSAWLADGQAAEMGLEFAISCLAAAHLLNEVGGGVSPKLGWEVLDLLAATTVQARPWQAEAELPPEAVAVEQILSCELPLTLSYLFSEMAPLRELRDEGRDRLAHGLSELLNGQGLPHGANISALRPLAACWTRCRAIGGKLKNGSWPEETQSQYQWVVEQLVRWTAPNGTPLLGDVDAGAWNAEFLQCALQLGGNKRDRRAAKLLLGKQMSGKIGSGGKKPTPAYESEWAGLALLRSEWSPAAPTVAVDYSSPEMRLEIWAEGRKLFNGIASVDTDADGKRLHPAGSWQNLCWFSDKDVDYLELKLELASGAWIERQILLARRDDFLLLADHLQYPGATAWEHRWQLPLAPGVFFQGEAETRDALLLEGHPVARLIPLALPEWRIDPRLGELSCDGNQVLLMQSAAARAMACPLFIDLKSKRCIKPATWRRLTIAESLEIQSAETAVGYRIQCGKQQWVYYRSLGPRGNRTLLGQNTSSEFLFARFQAPAGKIKELIEIEG